MRAQLNSAKVVRGGVAMATPLALLWVRSASALSLMDVFNGNYKGEGQPSSLFGGANAIIPKVINIMLFIVGILAIIMMIYGGIRYVLSGGDNNKVKDAKNTILYAVVGLVVAILGYAIVSWIVSILSGGSVGGDGDSGASVSLIVTTLLV